LKAEFKGLPVIALGGSMGGCVAARLGERLGANLSGLILAAPMLSLNALKKKCINSVLLPFSPMVSKIFPTIRVGQKEPHVCKEMNEHFINDPLNESSSIRARVADQCLLAVSDTRENAHNVVCPVLIFHSANDSMCDPEGSEMFLETISSVDKILHLFPADKYKYLWHDILSEAGNKDLKVIAVEWLLQHFPEVAATKIVVD